MGRRIMLAMCALGCTVLPLVAWGANGMTLPDSPAEEISVALPEVSIVKAVVVRVLSEGSRKLSGLNISTVNQELEVQLLEGPEKGDRIVVQNDYVPLAEGDKLFLRRTDSSKTTDPVYGVIEIERAGTLLLLFGLFVLVIVGFGGMQGIRSLVSLTASIFIILYLLIPALVSGFPPIITSVGIAMMVLFGAVFFTHGFNRRSLAAFLGTVCAVMLTGVLAWLFVSMGRLTGFGSDESIFLNINTGGSLDFAGLLLGSIIIGVLGVLDDIAITQAAVVKELLLLRGNQSLQSIFFRALRVGREHVAALVNTLVLAYTGAALPLLLWISSAGTNMGLEMNREMIAAEIVRTLVGSIGLVAAVPITTALAILFMRRLPLEALTAHEESGAHAHHHHHHS